MSIATQLVNLQATRYVSAGGLVAMLYDHMLTFADEVELVWRARWNLAKVLFLLARYGVPIIVLGQMYSLSGLSQPVMTDEFCKGWVLMALWFGLLSIAISNFIVLLRLWVLWERDRLLMAWTATIYVATQITTITAVAFSSVSIKDVLAYEPLTHTCVLTRKVHLAPLWSPGLVFEVMVFITTVLNAQFRPRDQRTAITTALYRDGFLYFIVLTSLRCINLALAVAAPLSLVFLQVYIIWCLSNVTLTRLVLNMRSISERGTDDPQALFNPSEHEHGILFRPSGGEQAKKRDKPARDPGQSPKTRSDASVTSSTPWDDYEMQGRPSR